MLNVPSRLGARHLALAVAVVYDAAMELLRSGKKEVAKFVTPSGVTGFVATCIPESALDKLIKKLERKLSRSKSKSTAQVDTTRP